MTAVIASCAAQYSSNGEAKVQWKHADGVFEVENEHAEGEHNQSSFFAPWPNVLVVSYAQVYTLARRSARHEAIHVDDDNYLVVVVKRLRDIGYAASIRTITGKD